MMARRFLFSIAAVFALLMFSCGVFAVGVRPLVVDLDLRPGGVEEFELVLSPGESEEIVNLNLYQPLQLLTGGLTYQEGDPETYQAIEWVKLENNRVVVPPGEEKTVKGRVEVPFNAGGSHTVVVMVEPEVEQAKTGITFRVRYAVRINIVVDRPGLRAQAEVLDFGLDEDEEGNPVMNMRLRNPSALHYNASAEVTIRDEKRRLVERVELRTPAAWQSGRGTTRIYPGAEVLFTGDVTEPLFPGDYQMKLFVRYAEGQQVIMSRDLSIESGDFPKAQEAARVKVEPETIDVRVRPGGASSAVVNIENRTGGPLCVKMGARDIESGYERSVYKHTQVQLRGNSEFELDARRRGRTVLTIRLPRDIEPGGYYGFLDIGVFSGETIIEKHSVRLDVIAEGKMEYKAEIVSLYTDFQDGEHLFTVDVRNLGSVHILPRARMYLKDGNGKIVRTLWLTLQEGLDSILPGQAGLTIGTARDIEPGRYMADITVMCEAGEIAAGELPVVIEERTSAAPQDSATTHE